MLVFPQLNTGAVAQFPFTTEYRARTAVNEAADGSLELLADPAAQTQSWRLQFRGLLDTELQALVSLHTAVAGGLRTFLFLDPSDNLLRWSESLLNDVWAHDALLTVSEVAGEGDAVHHLVNAAQVEQAIGQTLPAPAGLVYAFTFEVRTAERVRLAAERSASAAVMRTEFDCSTGWTRCVQSGRLAGGADVIDFRVVIPPGATVELRRLQVEAQTGASQYKPAYSSCGIYPATRFATDALRVTTQGRNDHEVSLELLSSVR
jgi:hypothetical protein